MAPVPEPKMAYERPTIARREPIVSPLIGTGSGSFVVDG